MKKLVYRLLFACVIKMFIMKKLVYRLLFACVIKMFIALPSDSIQILLSKVVRLYG